MHIPKFNSIRLVTSPIFAKEIFKIRAMAKPIPVYRGWVKTKSHYMATHFIDKSLTAVSR